MTYETFEIDKSSLNCNSKKVVCLKKKRGYWQDHLNIFFPNDLNEHKESCL